MGSSDNNDRYGSMKFNARKGRQQDKRGKGKGMKDIFDDWDLLLPSTDAYANGEDDMDEDDELIRK